MSKPSPADTRPSDGTRPPMLWPLVWCAAALGMVCVDANADDTLLLSRSVYEAPKSLITIGQPLPASGGKGAVADASFPTVFNNLSVDPNFGVTSSILIDQLSLSGARLGSLNVTSAAKSQGIDLSMSFSSKSEMSLSLSTNRGAVTFMGYRAPVNSLDVSNSNTPGHVDATNPDPQVFQRAIGQLNANGTLQVTPVNSYSGDNGRGAILDSAQNRYFTVGNAGNGSGAPTSIVNSTGVQTTTVGGSADPVPVGKQWGTAGAASGYQFGYSVTQNGYAADKSGKDNNFRGIAISGDTMYVTKGSGSNGVNTVYQVGDKGSLPNGATASTTTLNILPGFNTALAKTATGGPNPFGLWFADSRTLYVADEGTGKAADAGSSTFAGLQKWSLGGSGVWQLDYTLQQGLGLGVAYQVGDYVPTTTAGLRNLTGRVNSDGTVSLYAITATVSDAAEPGADPNRLVLVTDQLSFLTAAQASTESFITLETAAYGEVLRGVSIAPEGLVLAPVPEPETYALMLAGLGMLGFVRRRRSAATSSSTRGKALR